MGSLIKSSLMAFILMSTTQTWADMSIQKFMNVSQGTASFQCAYKTKTASKKCVVSRSMVKASIHPMTKQIYGANEVLNLLTIQWPDGDVSRYLSVDSGEAINLSDHKTYRYKSLDHDESNFDLRRGLILQSDTSPEHVRIW